MTQILQSLSPTSYSKDNRSFHIITKILDSIEIKLIFINEQIYKFQVKDNCFLLLSCFSRVRLCATPETAAYQAPPSLGCSRQNTGVGCHCLLQYYSAIKNEILSFAAIWMDLEIIILSEISQRKTNIIYHLHVQSKTGHK